MSRVITAALMVRHAQLIACAVSLAVSAACNDVTHPSDPGPIAQLPETSRPAQPADTSRTLPTQPLEGRIAFVSNDASTGMGGAVYVMNADGSSVKQLTHDTVFHVRPAWS